MPLVLISPAFPPGGHIPAQYTCGSADISPPLSWSGVPAGTKSLVLVIEDPDAPRGTFRHWGAYDIPPGTTGLAAGYHAGQPAAGFAQARNDFGAVGYGGPCPPPGRGAHHYRFELLALSRPRVDLPAGAGIAALLQAARPYVIARTELTGTYQR
jgi:Raf kinase inhibitor-like YbhB/YbcL family protein